MTLTAQSVVQIKGADSPEAHTLALPEKVLQFGTGVLLRALPDYFIDKANKKGLFNGRIVVVKSTESDSSAFDRQNGLYTVCVRGIDNGEAVSEDIIHTSISRVLSARTHWKNVLDLAANPHMEIILSNTTEVGIQLMDDDIHSEPPVSFPGKLLAFLYARFNAFKGAADKGMIIIPTELITDNGSKLERIVLELAHRNQLEYTFIEWLEQANHFCNSLVDRIVPGKPAPEFQGELEKKLGYTDELLTMSESFRLWAIEGDAFIASRLTFAQADPGMVIVPDITQFKELKLRLLNGTHTFNCGLAFLAGFRLTRDAVSDPVYAHFVRRLMQEEIAPAIPFAIDPVLKTDFANSVFDRFCNPHVDHQWLSITMQFTSKMKMRNLPLLLQHYKNAGAVPKRMAAGFAGYLLFMKAVNTENGRFMGEWGGNTYEIKDDSAAWLQELWAHLSADEVTDAVLSNETLWDADLRALPGFADAVKHYLNDFQHKGVLETIATLENLSDTK
jgi:tagaturonate reductase